MRVAEPMMVFLLVLVPLYWCLLWRGVRRRRRRLDRLLSRGMAERLSTPRSALRGVLRGTLMSLALFFAVVAALRPQMGLRLEAVERKGIDLGIALDTSRSMLAEDLAPSRLQVARREVRRLIRSLRGDRVGLIAFAGGAVLQSPLTLDYGAAELFLEVMDEHLVPRQGTAIGAAIDLARERLFAESRGERVLVLITDGEDHGSEPLAAARRAAQAGIRIYTVGIGSVAGSPVPAGEGEQGAYKKDEEGEIVLSRLDVATLETVAELTGGRYFHVEPGSSPVAEILEEIGVLERNRFEEQWVTVYGERFPEFLLLAILFLGLEAGLGVCRIRGEQGLGVGE